MNIRNWMKFYNDLYIYLIIFIIDPLNLLEMGKMTWAKDMGSCEDFENYPTYFNL